MDAQWSLITEKNTIAHVSGFQIVFDGEPESDYFTGSPRHFPPNLSSLQIATLIREGFDFYRKHFGRAEKAVRPILKLKAGVV